MVTLKPSASSAGDVLVNKVLDHCKSRMATYKKPKEVLIVDSFPLNSTGKIAKKVLKQQLEARNPK
jgi:acyl-CoA synthetase (AMP-forming)/AMP-acid ligase II